VSQASCQVTAIQKVEGVQARRGNSLLPKFIVQLLQLGQISNPDADV